MTPDDSANKSTRLPTLQSAEWLSSSLSANKDGDDSRATPINRSRVITCDKCQQISRSDKWTRHPFVNKFSHRTHLMRFGRRKIVKGTTNYKTSEIISSEKCQRQQSTVRTTAVIMLKLLVILGLTLGSSIASSSDSPAKLQRYKVQQQQLLQQPTNYADSSLSNRTDRVRRTNNQQRTRLHPDQECPSLSRLTSLVPAEYPQACCECVTDHWGWQITCFNASRTSECVPINAPARSQPARRPVPPGESQAHRRVHRSPARWMGDDEFLAAANANATTGGSDSLTRHVDESEHEGFGEELTTDRPSVSPASEQQANKQRSPLTMVTSNGSTISNNNNASIGEDGIISLSSSSSITLMQLRTQTDSTASQQPSHQQVSSGTNSSSSSSSSRSRLAQLQQQATSGSSDNDNHPMFQTVPVLFSVMYTRNNMIVIDCDLAAPNYKPAMFQGFNVNEISSFTFNSCQLPKITFSAILLRTGAPQSAPVEPQQPSAGAGRAAGGQALKPANRQRPHQSHRNLVRRQLDSEDQASLVVASESQREATVSRPGNAPAATKNEQPKVKSLTLNVHTVVDQRTLIYLLTGLNSLEELELNYVQLNLTNYELDDLAADPTTPLPSSSVATSSSTTASAVETLANLAQPNPSLAQARGPQVTASQPQQLLTPSAGTSTTASPNLLLVATSGSVSPATRTLAAATTAGLQSTAMRAPPSTTQAPNLFTSSAAPQTTTSTTTTTTTSPTSSTSTTTAAPITASSTMTTQAAASTTTTSRPQTTSNSNRPRVPPVNLLRPVQAQNRPNSLGSPRGLLSSGGIPTTTQATTTSTTSMPSAAPQTTAGPPTTLQQQQQQQRQQVARMQNQTTLPANLISVAASQSVSYTSQAGANQATGPQQLRANQQMTVAQQQPPISSNILLSQSSQSQQHQHLPTTTRLHQAPSAWFQPSTTANTNTNGFTQTPAGATSSAGSQTPAADQSLTGPINTPYASSLHTNGFGIRTSPASSASLPVSLALYNSNSPGGFRSAATTNRLQPMQSTGLRALGAATTTTQSSSMNPQAAESTLQFQMVAGGGRGGQPMQLVASRRQLPTMAASSQRSSHSAADEESSPTDLFSSAASESSPTFAKPGSDSTVAGATEAAGEHQRFRRHAARSLDEFELSFGELLPSLKSLKLVGFIDLPKAAGEPPQSAGRAQVQSIRQRQTQRPNRVRRQFQPSDVPERDEGHMSDSESEAIAAAASSGESLLAEETSVHHNSVMAADSMLSRSGDSRRSSASLAPPTFSDSSSDSADHDGWLVSASNAGDSVAPTSSPALQTEEQQQQSFGRVKRLSLVLVKMLSKLTKLRVLHLRSNDIPYWPDRVLHDSRHSLALLYLMSNNIRQLGRSSFANLTELEALDLSANQLRQLSPDQFRDLAKLTDLRARRNLFRKFPASVLAKLTGSSPTKSQLIKVDFSQNRYLTQLAPADSTGPAAKQAPVSVESLNLADCSLGDQMAGKSPEWLFASLPDLVQLSLAKNKLRELLTTSYLFGKNSKLKELDVSHNQLTSLASSLFNGNASQIVELYLNYNQLTQIPDQFLFNLRRLRKLSLAHNKLNQLPANLFLTNPLIESIDLSHNQLVTLNTQHSGRIPFGNGANLRRLSLAHNNLSDFELDVNRVEWMFYPHLQVLDLSHNKFQGQISMPIFHLVAAEMLLNLSSNSIQSVNVDAQSQRDHWDRYAAYEPPADNASSASAGHAAQTKVPTVDIRLTGNPIACDCMLEPLISYSRRVALATNPTLVATIFPSRSPAGGRQPTDGSLPPGSRYSVLAGKPGVVDEQGANAQANDAKQPQVFYQFKLTDVYCAQPADLQRQLLSHINIGDLLCPISDEPLCPRQCHCYYQSAFKTAIVDCSNKQLTNVPEQLTDAANFAHFAIESTIFAGQDQQQRPSASADTLIIRLDNNKLTSMERLSKLFTVTRLPADQLAGGRFARAPAQRTLAPPPAASYNQTSQPGEPALKPNELILSDDEDPLEPLARAQAQPLSSSAPPSSVASGRRSPVAVGRGMMGAQSPALSRQRSRRNIGSDLESAGQPAAGDAPATGNDYDANQLGGETATNADGLPVASTSTAVLESAEEFRNKRYPMTCQLYLDHNLIESIPESFVEALDRVQSSSIQLTLAPPQAALPSFLVEPPVHIRLDHLADVGEVARPGGATTGSPVAAAIVSGDNPASNSNELGGESAFGRRPLVPPERKAALMEAMSQNVKLRQQQAQTETKWSVSPALVALSLRHNNLARIDAKMLDRLSKLIRSSNTQLYFGHNPFNCTDNQAPAPELLNASPMGDQLLAASDSSSGAYLEIAADDLAPSASSGEASISAPTSAAHRQGQATSDTCPVGQLQRWLTINHGNVRDLDEVYCVHMSPELTAKLRTNNSSSGSNNASLNEPLAPADSSSKRKWEHDHPWASSLMLSAAMGGSQNGSQLEKNGVRWDSEQLLATARLINLNPNDLCPYSASEQEALAAQLLSTSHQRVLLGVAMVFMLISLCLLLMLIYFGDTQTMLAFVYIHMNPIYSCLRLNESHLDGDKLYDAFVSYSSADRDIVMELIERLEQQPDQQQANNNNKDFGQQQMRALSPNPMNAAALDRNGTLNRRTNSFQDLSTMSRSTPRLMLAGDEFGGSALDVAHQPSNIQASGVNAATSTPYRLCIHERDWLPGHMISWNISNSVQNSRRTILILSKEFIKSVWFQVEFHTAYYQMLEDRIDRLIVIVRGELPPKKELDKDLAFLLTTKTYLTWGEKWFWERLHYALPHKSQPAGKLAKPMAPPPAALPIKRHQQHNNYGTSKKSSADLSASLSKNLDGHNQKPLIMSSIGKDLMLPNHGNQPAAMIGSSSSSGSAASNTRSSSSFFSGSSTGNLLSTTTAATNQPTMVTTTNSDLLTATTRLTIGPSATDTSGQLGDSGRVTASLSGASLTIGGSPATQQSTQPNVTSIRLDGNQTTVTTTAASSNNSTSSKARAKKQERLQNFVDKSISTQLHLSEL